MKTDPLHAPAGKPPRREAPLKVGLAAIGKSYLPNYVAAEQTGLHEGLHIELVSVAGSPALMQALAGGSLDIAIASLNGVISAIHAGQPFKVVYVGNTLGDYRWFADPSIQSWAQLRGKRLGASARGSLTESLSRVALTRHGLIPEQDVELIAVGSNLQSLQALQAGRVDVVIINNPFGWQAEAEGYRVIGSLADFADGWPQNAFVVTERMLAEEPDTVRAFLRAHVRAIRAIETDRAMAIQTLIQHARFTQEDAERSYDELLPYSNERGDLPHAAMPYFWDVMKLTDDIAEPWEESRYLDRRFIDTFDQWAPPR